MMMRSPSPGSGNAEPACHRRRADAGGTGAANLRPAFACCFLVLVPGAWRSLLLQHPGLGLVALAGLSFTLPFTLGTGSEVALTAPVFLIPVVSRAWLVDGLRETSPATAHVRAPCYP